MNYDALPNAEFARMIRSALDKRKVTAELTERVHAADLIKRMGWIGADEAWTERALPAPLVCQRRESRDSA